MREAESNADDRLEGAGRPDDEATPTSEADPIEFPVEVRPTAAAMFGETVLGGVGIMAVLFGLMWITGIGNHTFRIIAAVSVGALSIGFYSLRFFAKAPSFVRIDEAELIIEGQSGIEHFRWDAMTRAAHRSMMGLRWEFYDATFGELEEEADEEDLLDDHEPLAILRDDGFSSSRWTLVSRAIAVQLERRSIPITRDDNAESFDE